MLYVSMDSSTASAVEAALFYANLGWRVVPTSGRLKHPVLDDWQNLATTDPERIKALFAASPPHAQDVAIVTGRESGIFVLDVDPRHGGDDTLDDLTATYGHLPDTPMSITGSQGQHFVFRYPEGLEIKNSAGNVLGPGLDIRGDNGQVSAPPTVHENGQRYAWEVSLDPEDTPVADAPSWLIQLLTQVPEAPERAPRRARPDGELLPGDRFNEEHTWEELLEAVGAEKVGWRRDREGNLMEFWSRPRLDGETHFVPHTSATLGYKGSDVLKVFTPNWPPLQEGHTYDKLGFWAEYSFEGANHDEKVARAVSQLAYEAMDTAFEPWFAEFEAHLAEINQVEEKKAIEDSSWVPRSLREARKAGPPPPPDMLRREDDECLLYRGKLHYFYGPPECGKSWAAQIATAQAVIEDLEDVLYWDFENDPFSFTERLDVLEVDDEGLDRITYFNPDRPLTETTWAYIKSEFLTRSPKLIVVDGISNAMSLLGCDPLTHADAVRFEMMFLRPLCLTGAAVVCIDHAPKTQGDAKPSIFGAQHKLAQVTGATFLFQTVKPFGRDMDGLARMLIQKDKPGYLRRLALGGSIANLEIDATNGFQAKLAKPTADDGERSYVPSIIMENLWSYVDANPGKFRREVLEAVPGKRAWKTYGLDLLVKDGYLDDNLGLGRLYPVKPFGPPRPPSVIDQLDSNPAWGGQTTPLVRRGEEEPDDAMAKIRRQMRRDGFDDGRMPPGAELTDALRPSPAESDDHQPIPELAAAAKRAEETRQRFEGVSAEPERSEGEARPGTVCAAKSGDRSQEWDPF